jgi:hypothetical protein
MVNIIIKYFCNKCKWFWLNLGDYYKRECGKCCYADDVQMLHDSLIDMIP